MKDIQPAIGEPPAVQFIAVNRLKIDPAYQRNTVSKGSQLLIDGIRRKWDWRLCVPLLVSARGQELFIIDGQHRWEGAKLRGDIAFLPCAVGQYGSAAEEAALFVAANRKRVTVNRLDLFRASLGAGDPATLTIDRLMREAGLAIGTALKAGDLKPGEINCVSALYRMLAQKGEERLRRVLQLAGWAFTGQSLTFPTLLLDTIMVLTGPLLGQSDEQLLRALSTRKADEWARLPAVMAERGGQGRVYALRREIGAAIKLPNAQAQPELEPAPAPAPVAVAASRPSKLRPGETAWCEQCDQRVGGARAAACKSAFCKMKVAA